MSCTNPSNWVIPPLSLRCVTSAASLKRPVSASNLCVFTITRVKNRQKTNYFDCSLCWCNGFIIQVVVSNFSFTTSVGWGRVSKLSVCFCVFVLLVCYEILFCFYGEKRNRKVWFLQVTYLCSWKKCECYILILVFKNNDKTKIKFNAFIVILSHWDK